MPSFGRLESPDERDKAYGFGLVIPAEYPKVIKRKMWTPPGVLNQGQASRCVGYGWYGWAGCTPTRSVVDPVDVYNRATTLDEWPGNEGDPNSGTSVRAGAKAIEQLGRMKAYLWAYSAKEVANWILRQGPVVIGVPWYQGMMQLSSEGYVIPSGSQVGGHCVLVYGADTIIQTLYIQNSWGSAWGHVGKCKMTFDVLDNLLSDHGECCAAVERVLP